MTVSWPAFIAALAGAFVALNFAFALVYALRRGADRQRPTVWRISSSSASRRRRPPATATCIPQTIYGHVVATAENFVGVMLLATMTGLVFARISRPRARIIFAKYPVVTEHNGVTTLIFRLANARSNFISEASAKLWMIERDRHRGGQAAGRFPSQCGSSSPRTRRFALSWMLFHPIDERQSAVRHGQGDALRERDQLRRQSSSDSTKRPARPLHARDVFAAQDVRFGHEYVDFVWVDDEGLRHIDYAKIDATQIGRAVCWKSGR